MPSAPEIVSLRSERLAAEVNPIGAELHALRDGEGRDLLWNGDPAVWVGRAPILFPVIGVVNGGTIRVDGRPYPMPKHGIARRRQFEVVEAASDAATFRLQDDAETRASYPFAFRLDIRFALQGEALTIEATVSNPGETMLPASFGFHPALRWPLPGGTRDTHRIRFDGAEPEPIRRIDASGLLQPQPLPTPVEGRDLQLRDALFEDDALIFDRIASRGLLYGPAHGPELRVTFPDMPMLGVWTKPGAGFLCIEPWAGIADPEGFEGEFRDKPGVMEIAPGGSRRFAVTIALADGRDG